MPVPRDVIQAIRLKRLAGEAESLIALGESLKRELLEVSGLLERGIDPRNLNLSPELLAELNRQAAEFEQDLASDPLAMRRERGPRKV